MNLRYNYICVMKGFVFVLAVLFANICNGQQSISSPLGKSKAQAFQLAQIYVDFIGAGYTIENVDTADGRVKKFDYINGKGQVLKIHFASSNNTDVSISSFNIQGAFSSVVPFYRKLVDSKVTDSELRQWGRPHDQPKIKGIRVRYFIDYPDEKDIWYLELAQM